jgi:hypothetical protein
VHVPVGLELDGDADLFDGEAHRDWYPNMACGNEVGDLVDGVGGVGAVGRCDSVDLGGDGGDALVPDAEFPCSVHGVGPVKIDRGGDAVGCEGMDPVTSPSP